jgi:hypothetical protein
MSFDAARGRVLDRVLSPGSARISVAAQLLRYILMKKINFIFAVVKMGAVRRAGS